MLLPIIGNDLIKINRQIEALKATLKESELTVQDRKIFKETLLEMKQRKNELERRKQ